MTTIKDKPKRQLSEEQLEKLKVAREKALERRREQAKLNAMEKDLLANEKEAKANEIKERHAKLKSKAERTHEKSETILAEPETEAVAEHEPEHGRAVQKSHNKKQKKVIIESSDSESDTEIVYVKKRSKPRMEEQRAEKPISPPQYKHQHLYDAMFSGRGAFSRRF